MLYVGADVHLRSSVVCILDENGREIKTRSIRGGWKNLVEVLRGLKEPFAVCYEASCGYGVLYDALKGVAHRVTVAHPGQLRLIFRSKRKNDRVDARKLAKLLFLDEVPPVHVPRFEVRSWRELIEYRHRVVEKRTRVKNGLRTLLRGCGIVTPGRSRLWSSRGQEWLRDLEFVSPLHALRRDLMQSELEQFNEQIRRVEAELNRIGTQHPGVTLLQTIPGVGPRTAEAVVAYIDDPHRFRRSKCVGSYFGLVPSQDASGGMNHLGRITREGPGTVRRLLIEATWQGIRRSVHLKAHYERVGRGDPERRKIALVATAHHLVRSMHAMLMTSEEWNESPRKSAA